MSQTAKTSWSQRAQTAQAMVCAVVLFGSVNLISTLHADGLRLDLTEQSLFTLAPETKTVIGSIKEPITVKLYQSRALLEQVPDLQTYATQVTEMLKVFEQIAGGNIRFEVEDVLPFSAAEDQALAYRLAGFNLNRTGERGYFGLVGTNSLDGLESIEFLDPSRQAFLQYDLTRFVYRLTQTTEPKIAVLDGLSLYGSPATGKRPAAILNLLSEDFELTAVEADAKIIPPDTDVLVVTHPARLAPASQFAIDQYVLGGGAALVFLDPLAENSPPDPTNQNRPQNPSSDLAPLMAAWGLSMDPAKVVGDREMALETTGVAGQQRVVADYLPWLRIGGAALNPNEPITARLEVMRMSSAGSIMPIEGAQTSVTPLIQSTPNSMLLDRDTVMRRPNPNTFLDAFVASGQRHNLAVRVTGDVKTAFPDGAPAEQEGEMPAVMPGQEPLAQSVEPINVIVVADTDMLTYNHVIGQDGRLNSSNADFVLNAIGDLAGGDGLIGLRGGGLANRPFTTILQMQAQADEAHRATEQRLTEEMSELQQKVLQLQGTGDENDPLQASREQAKALDQFNARMVEVRQQLRDVQRALRSDIDTLENWVKFFNIAFVPMLLIILAIAAALWKRLRLGAYMRRFKPTGKRTAA